MKFNIMIVCNGTPQETYVSEFLPRVGDTIIGSKGIPMRVIEVIYDININDAAMVNTVWR